MEEGFAPGFSQCWAVDAAAEVDWAMASTDTGVRIHERGSCNPCVFFFSDYGCMNGDSFQSVPCRSRSEHAC